MPPPAASSSPGDGALIIRYAEAVGEPLDSGRATQCKVHYGFAASPKTGILYAATHLSAPGDGPDGRMEDLGPSCPSSSITAVAWSSARMVVG